MSRDIVFSTKERISETGFVTTVHHVLGKDEEPIELGSGTGSTPLESVQNSGIQDLYQPGDKIVGFYPAPAHQDIRAYIKGFLVEPETIA